MKNVYATNFNTCITDTILIVRLSPVVLPARGGRNAISKSFKTDKTDSLVRLDVSFLVILSLIDSGQNRTFETIGVKTCSHFFDSVKVAKYHTGVNHLAASDRGDHRL